ncbi:hypothetical protein IFO70_11880 [Phormidium tenue FACHB-886]|nr:hypothetical protein [Phormidium tenue FACHB-886]
MRKLCTFSPPNPYQQLSLIQSLAPNYEASPFLTLDPVPTDVSLPGQRYWLAIKQADLIKKIPVQLHPEEGDRLYRALRELNLDLQLDLDSGELVSEESRDRLADFLEAFFGGGES